MALATRTINGNNSGALPRKPKVVVMHSTRSGIASKTDASELTSTINWFTNPAGASSHWIISKVERVRCVADTLLAWHSGTLNGKAWGVEFTQPTIDRAFGKGHYANATLIGRHYVKLGVKPVWLSYWDGNLTQSGFVDHQDTVQGRASGKSDMGPKFDRARFIASLEGGLTMSQYTELKASIAKTNKLHSSNRSFRRRVMRLLGKTAEVGYQVSPATAKARLDSVIAYAKDLKKMIDSGRTVP